MELTVTDLEDTTFVSPTELGPEDITKLTRVEYHRIPIERICGRGTGRKYGEG